MLEDRPLITVENAHLVKQSTVIMHDRACCLAWSPDSKVLAIGNWIKTDWSQTTDIDFPDKPCSIWLYSIAEPDQPLLQLQGHQHTVSGLAFSPDGKLLVSAAYDMTIRSWNVQSGTQRKLLRTSGYSIHSLAFSSDGTLLAAGGPENESDPWNGNGVVAIWNVGTGTQEMLLRYDRVVGEVVFNPDGTLLAFYTMEGNIHLLDVKKQQKLAFLNKETETEGYPTIVEMAFEPQGLLLGYADDYKSSLQIWNWKTGECRTAVVLPYTRSPAFHPTESLMACIDYQGATGIVYLWDWASEDWTTNEPLQVLELESPHILSTSFSPDGRVLATVDREAVRLWSVS